MEPDILNLCNCLTLIIYVFMLWTHAQPPVYRYSKTCFEEHLAGLDKPLVEKKDLLHIQDGMMPKKIRNSFGGFTAEQWKSCTVVCSIYPLWNILPKSDLQLWQDFVMACAF